MYGFSSSSEAGGRGGGGRVQADDLMDVGHFEDVLYMLAGAGSAHLSSRLPHLSGHGDDDSDAGAVEMGNAREIEDDFLPALADKFFRGPFHLPAVVAHGDFSDHFENDDVRRKLPGLNGQRHKRNSFGAGGRRLTKTIEQGTSVSPRTDNAVR